jgi:hypothetical protein
MLDLVAEFCHFYGQSEAQVLDGSYCAFEGFVKYMRKKQREDAAKWPKKK